MPTYRLTTTALYRVSARDARTARRAFTTLVRERKLTPRTIVAAEPWGTYLFAPSGKPKLLRIQLVESRYKPRKTRIKKPPAKR